MQLDISGGFYQSVSLPVSAQQLVNAFVQTPETQGAFSDNIIVHTPGLEWVTSSGADAFSRNRGAIAMAGVPYFVNGNGLYALREDGTLSGSLGTVTGNFDQRVSLAQNGNQLMILVPGGDGFIYTAATADKPASFDIIADPVFTDRQATHVVFNDSYFICSTLIDSTGEPNGKQFIISGVNDGQSWNALDFGSAEASPDPIVAPWAFKDRLYMMGSYTLEPFRNIGGADFPFQAIQGGVQIEGLVAPFSLVNGQDHFYWIGGGDNERPAIWRSDGQNPQKVSTLAIDSIIQTFTQESLEQCYATYEAIGGNHFLIFHFPDRAFGFNEANGLWHERQTNGGMYRVSSVVEAYGDLYAADIFDGRIGRIDANVYGEYEEQYVRRTLISSPFNLDINAFSLPLLELTMETGAANLDDKNPIVRLSVSRDGGKTFGPEDPRSLGAIGEFGRKVVWRRKGRVDRSAVLKFEFASPTTFIIIRLDAKIQAGVQRFNG